MALPCARRPAIVEEELQEAREKDEGKWKKMKFDRYKIFQDMMGDWYANLKNCDKKKLTLKKLKRIVLVKLYEIKYEYNNLPKNWLESLIEMYDIKIHTKVKKDETYCPEGQISVHIDPLLLKPQKKSKLPVVNDGDEVDGMKKRKSPAESGCDDEETNVDVPKKRCKKVIDLTNEPPPEFWLKAYSEGVHLPRFLTTASTDDLNIIYYDYSPKLKTEEPQTKEYKPRVHDANGFNWFRTD